MTTTESAPTRVPVSQTWPRSRFYWAILESPGYARSGTLPLGLLAALADDIPETLDALHAVCTPIPRDSPTTAQRVLVCACPAAELAALDPSILELKPDGIPTELSLSADITLPNLLTGEHEPAPLRSARRARHTIAALAILLCSLLVSVGLARRARHAALSAIHATHIADSLLADLTSDRRESTLAAAAANTKSLASAAHSTRLPRDAAIDLASLLSAWPATTTAKPQSLSIADNAISLAVTIESDPSTPATSTDPALFLRAFTAPSGMTLDEPRIATLAGISRINLTLRPGAPTPVNPTRAK